MKANAIGRIIIYSIVLVMLVGLLIGGMDFSNFRFEFGDDSGEYSTGGGDVPIEDIDNIEIEWVSGSAAVTVTTEKQYISFAETGSTQNCSMVYEVRGRTLVIRYEKPAVHIGIANTPSKHLTVTVPSNWVCKNLDIEVVSADVDVLLLGADSVDVESVSGTVDIHVLSAVDVSIETVSGNSSLCCEEANKIDCSTVSGDFSVHLFPYQAKEVDFESVSGDLTVSVQKTVGFKARLDGINGKIYSDYTTSNHNGYCVYGDGAMKIDAESMSGSLYIRENMLALTDGSDSCQHIYGSSTVAPEPGSGVYVNVQKCILCGHTETSPADE